jgi:hypothetical protein
MSTVAKHLMVFELEFVTAIESESLVSSAVTAHVNNDVSCVTEISVTTPTNDVEPPIFLIAPSYLL